MVKNTTRTQYTLLALKTGDKYLKLSDEGWVKTNVSKATVFQPTDEEKLRNIFQHLKPDLPLLEMIRLTIIEEHLAEGLR